MAEAAAGLDEGFVHLRVRSAYSLLEGAIKAGDIGKLAAGQEMPAAALTDRANLFGALEYSRVPEGLRRAADHRLRPAGHRHR